jgi:hypothetical protein
MCNTHVSQLRNLKILQGGTLCLANVRLFILMPAWFRLEIDHVKWAAFLQWGTVYNTLSVLRPRFEKVRQKGANKVHGPEKEQYSLGTCRSQHHGGARTKSANSPTNPEADTSH